jgi:hypothetical protein
MAWVWLLFGDRFSEAISTRLSSTVASFRNRQCSLPCSQSFLHGVGQDTEPLDLHFEDIAGLHEDGWLARRSDATRRAGDDHIASLQTHRDTDHFNQRRDTEDELVGARILHHAAISNGPGCAIRWPRRHGIGRHQPRAERSGAIEILAHRPLRCAELKITHGRIVEQGVARHVIEGLLRGMRRPGLPITTASSAS